MKEFVTRGYKSNILPFPVSSSSLFSQECSATVNVYHLSVFLSVISLVYITRISSQGDVDVICGGPPCQGISGFNRFRNKDAPLEDEKNHQLVVYMDIIDYLKPKYVLMENVVDILKFAGGFLGRHAIGRLVAMNYQARLGMMAAGYYGLPQHRMRVFLWGAQPDKVSRIMSVDNIELFSNKASQ